MALTPALSPFGNVTTRSAQGRQESKKPKRSFLTNLIALDVAETPCF